MQKEIINNFDISNLIFNEKGLIPAIVQDIEDNRVLMMAWMNKESLSLSIEKKYTYFFSRSRNKLWKKGETSSNTQEVISITADCDADCLLIKVKKNGPACHTGRVGCFFNNII